MKKSLLFIVGSLSMGGVETYTVRLAKYLSPHIEIKILILSSRYNDELFEEASKYATIYFLHEYIEPYLLKNNTFIRNIAFLFPINYQKLLLDIDGVNFIHATGSESLGVSNALLKYSKLIRISLGIYHSKEFIWKSNFYFRKIEKKILLSLPAKNILSCNESTSTILEKSYKKSFNLPIIPIGVEMHSQKKLIFNVDSNKIVSIGRLVNFKTYNEDIINAIDEINELYSTSYEYHIYGYGKNEEKLRLLADKKKSKIVFHGVLDYSRLEMVLSDCILFVGSGTSIIESSSYGIPSLIGIESNKKSETYGFFSDLIGFSYNEDNLNLQKNTYIEIISEYIKKSPVEKRNYSSLHIQKAHDFSILKTSKIFLLGIEKLASSKYCFYNSFRYKVSYITWLILNKVNLINELETRYEN